MEKKDINTREDIALLVDSFYIKIRKDTTLGPIFNEAIKDWDKHLEHLTTFWESSLFFTRKLTHKYKGNPLEKHVKVDKDHNNTITEHHFGIWLNYWMQTIDNLFQGEVVDNAKRRARKMGSFMYLKIFEARSSNQK
ncbi:MAG: group III truncated hemoglobin [Lacinutrix sp.]|uniref:group III truncated hemoglobin n=1 Tax=Lacinutrix sp. TaxID=1937692 RepID=UPI0030A3DC81